MYARLEQLKRLGLDNPYSSEGKRDTTIEEARVLAIKNTPERKNTSERNIVLSGRVTAIRKHGKLIFCDIEDQENKIQIIFDARTINHKPFIFAHKCLCVYDIIEIRGTPVISKTGEPSIIAEKIDMVAPCLQPPKKATGIMLRFSNRTGDMIVNPKARKRLILRSRILHRIRSIMEKYDFLETTTPVLQGKYGGGKSKPFTSHCNSLNREMFLRATMDLYLKRIVAGGIDRVYEIGKCFRNESICNQYNPEFLMLEAYGAYMQSSEMVGIIKEIVEIGMSTVQSVFPQIYGKGDIGWRELKYKEACRDYLGIDVSNFQDLDGIKKQCEERKLDTSGIRNLSDLHNKLGEMFLGKKFVTPTILTGLPVETSPLMKRSKEDPTVLDRSWFFANSIMFCDLAGELSDPSEQFSRLKEQKEDLVQSYDNVDDRHIEALKIGCPFLSGIGFGFDRFLLGITMADNIRENIPFPIAYEVIKKDPQPISKQVTLQVARPVGDYTISGEFKSKELELPAPKSEERKAILPEALIRQNQTHQAISSGELTKAESELPTPELAEPQPMLPKGFTNQNQVG